MSELAFNGNGESFEVPAAATAWRVRRMKPRGAPELVYAQDGRPLSLPIDAGIEDLREAVDANGKYRLDAMNEDGRCIESVPPAYVHVAKRDDDDDEDPVGALRNTSAPASTTDETVREAMRLNTALAKSVIDRFPDMLQAASELLRAADGAGIPARETRIIDVVPTSDDAETTEPAEQPRGFDLNTIIGHVVSTLATSVLNGSVKLPGLAGIVDWRKAAALADAEAVPVPRKRDGTTRRRTSTQPAFPPIDAATLAHFTAIQAALTPEEAALARSAAAELEPAELRSWFDELAKLSVPDAVQRVRSQIAGGAS